MAFFDEAIPFLRVLIGDSGENAQYCTSKLEQLLIVSSHIINKEIYFPAGYVVTISTLSISPDPYEDPYFINFAVLKAACLVDQTTYRTKAALEGIRANVGPASLSVAGHAGAFQKLLELGPCQQYNQMKIEYMSGQNLVYTVQAILTPFVSSVFSPVDHLAGGTDRSRLGGSQDLF